MPSPSDTVLTELHERLKHIVRQERSNYGCHDYLYDTFSPITADQIVMAKHAQKIRKEIIFKLIEIVDHLVINREVVHAAVSMIDRYLSLSPSNFLPREDGLPIDLIGISALCIAIKFQVGVMARRHIPFIYSSAPIYTTQDYHDAEFAILNILKWNVNFPSPASIIQDLAAAIPAPPRLEGKFIAVEGYKDFIIDRASYFTLLALLEYDFVPRRPSSIALAAIMVTIEIEEDFRRINNTLNPPKESPFISIVELYFGDCISCLDDEVRWCFKEIHRIWSKHMHCFDRPSSPRGPEIFEGTPWCHEGIHGTNSFGN